MTTDHTAIDLTRRESFDAFTPVTIRFSDQDSMGHINNVSLFCAVRRMRTRLSQPTGRLIYAAQSCCHSFSAGSRFVL